jgi:hypothetical protein
MSARRAADDVLEDKESARMTQTSSKIDEVHDRESTGVRGTRIRFARCACGLDGMVLTVNETVALILLPAASDSQVQDEQIKLTKRCTAPW